MQERRKDQDDFVLPENVLEEGNEIPRDRPGRLRRERREPDEPVKKTSRIFRIVAWMGLVVLFFAIGYGGASYGLKKLSEKKIITRPDVVQDAPGAAALLGAKGDTIALGARKTSVTLTMPKDGTLVQEKISILSDLMEDDIRTCVARIASAAGIPKDVSLLHVFRNGEVAFLDFDAEITNALAKAGEQNSLLFITGVLRTLQDNFPPVAIVRFLVKGQVTRGNAPVDLTVPWRLPK